jgi:hypothetical protein
MDAQERINREIQQLEREIEESTRRTHRIEHQMTPSRPRERNHAPQRRLEFSEQNKLKRPLVTPQTFDGTTPLMDFQAHFSTCAGINKWTQEEKGLYLAVSLRGQAQQLLGSGTPDYDKLMDSLERRFAPKNQTEIYRVQLKSRKRREHETLPELGQAIRRLASQAYPKAPEELLETLSKEQFIDSLTDSELRLRIQQACPKTFDEAIQVGVELEAFNRAEFQRKDLERYARTVTTSEAGLSDIQELKREVAELKTLLKDLTAKSAGKNGTKGSPICYKCGEIGHFKRVCPKSKPKLSEN